MSATKVGIRVYCTVCQRSKLPRGRSAPLGAYGCDDDCAGYRLDPVPGDLWPGETDDNFGYPCSDHATQKVDAQ